MYANPLSNPVNKPFVPVHWKGMNGTVYEFQLHLIGTDYFPKPGVYIFCRDLGGGSFSAIYVGETDNFKRRLTDELKAHHSLEGVRRHGATHICTLHVPGNLSDRLRIETDLRNALNPPCNKQ
jgi:hypothetical protein